MNGTPVAHLPDGEARDVPPLLMRVGHIIDTVRDHADMGALKFFTVSSASYDDQRTKITVQIMRPSTRAWHFAVAHIEHGDNHYVLDADHADVDTALDRLYEACEKTVG